MYNQLGWGAYSALGAQQLSQNTIRMGYAGGLNEVSYSKSNIKSVSEEISHGFTSTSPSASACSATVSYSRTMWALKQV